ncbi:MAG: D-aminoacylase [Cyclobacteriaceae bacterium]|nr:D-aminoacylase [Cyclobacteriaceae bacterium]
MKKIFPVLILLISACTSHTDFDIILKNGTIYDGSGKTPFTGDIGISHDTIAAIGNLEDATGKQIRDLQGLAVAPGFINMLSWANVSLIEDGRSQSDIRQGVTLEILGEGRSMGPLNDTMKLKMVENQGDIKYDIKWTTLGEYLQYMEDKGVSTNIASFIGNGTVRQHVIGNENRPATPEELLEMKALVQHAMEEGAVGISSSLLYAPSGYANTEELIELAKVASKFNGMYISHIRNEGDQLLEAIEELITISREAKIPSEVYHLKASGQSNWHKMDSVIEKIEQARQEGLAVTADMYTYSASSTGLHVQLPDWVREGGVEATIQRLSDASLRDSILKDIEFTNPPDRILLTGFRNEALRKYAGKRLNEVADILGKSPEETMVDLIVEDDSRIQVVYFSMSEDNIKKKVALPWMSFCSDAGSYTNEGVFIKQITHPRAYGSFIRVLSKFSRDENVLTLQEAIRKLAALPAQNLKLKKRGMLKTGNYADIVVFDPNEIKDVATFEDPHQYSEGMVHVWVNGVQVLEDGNHTDAKPGRFIKGSGWKGE